MIVDEDGTSHEARPREALTLQTLVDIPSDGHIAVLNNDTRAIFRSIGTGRFSVAALISEARRQSDATIKRTISEIKNDTNHKNGGTNNKPQGGCFRNTPNSTGSADKHGRNQVGRNGIPDDDMAFDYRVAQIISHAILSGYRSEDSPLSYRRVYSADSSYVYAITSTAEEPLYVNIAIVSPTSSRLLFTTQSAPYQSCLMVSKGENIIDAFEFYGGENENFVLIATDIPFDVRTVDTLLRKGLRSSTKVLIPSDIKLWISTM